MTTCGVQNPVQRERERNCSYRHDIFKGGYRACAPEHIPPEIFYTYFQHVHYHNLKSYHLHAIIRQLPGASPPGPPGLCLRPTLDLRAQAPEVWIDNPPFSNISFFFGSENSSEMYKFLVSLIPLSIYVIISRFQ